MIANRALGCCVMASAMSLLVSPAFSASPPKEMFGKSVTVNWTESREQRPLGEQNWRTVSGPVKVLIYVSEAGRIFKGGTTTTAGGTAKLNESIAGSTGNVTAVFSGRRLVVTTAAGKHLRRVTIDFDQGFASCTAAVAFAKQAGAEISQEYSNIINRMNEVKAAQISGTNCGVATGNVFAGN